MAASISSQIELQQVRSSRLTNRIDPNDSGSNIYRESQIADAQVPEGGYGWWVVSGIAVVIFWAAGLSYSWGVIQAALVKDGVASASTLSFVGSLMPACISFLGIFVARFLRIIGARKGALLSAFLTGAGAVLSGFTTRNVGGLFVTTGVIMGVGLSFCFMIASTVPAQYFKAKRGFSNGIVYAGGGLGGACLSFAMDALIQKWGVAWAFRVAGLMTWMTGLPAAWLVKERVPIRPSAFIEWGLFRDFRFAMLFVASAVATFPLFVPPFFLPLFCNTIGLSSGTSAGILAAFNFSSALGRLVSGLLGDLIGPVNTLFLSLLLSALSMLVLWPVSTSLAPMVLFAIINGASNGGFFSTMPTVVGNTFGSLRVTVAMGMIVTGWAGGYLMGAPIAGFILDASGGERSLEAFRPAILYAGSMALGSTSLVGFIRLRATRKLLGKI